MPPWALPSHGPGEISWGKDEQLPAASVPNTVLPRLDIGRRVDRHACPDRPALRDFTCVRCCGSPRASIPHALAGKAVAVKSQLRPRAVASGSWLPPTGSIKDLHLQSFIHAQRTRYGCASAPAAAQPKPWSSNPTDTLITTGTENGGTSKPARKRQLVSEESRLRQCDRRLHRGHSPRPDILERL